MSRLIAVFCGLRHSMKLTTAQFANQVTIDIDTYFRIKPPMISVNHDHLYDSQHRNRLSKAGRSEKQIAIQTFLNNKEIETADPPKELAQSQMISSRDQPSSTRDPQASMNELAMDTNLTKKIQNLQKSEKEIKDPSLKTEEVNYGLLAFPEAAIKDNLDIVMPRNRMIGKPNRSMIKPLSLPHIRCNIETKKPFQVMQGSSKTEMLKKLSGSKSFWGEVPNQLHETQLNSRNKYHHPRGTQIALEKPKDRGSLQKLSQAAIEESKPKPAAVNFPYSRYGEKKKMFEEKNKEYLNRNFENSECKQAEILEFKSQKTKTKTLPKLQLRRSTNKEPGTIKINVKADVENIVQLMALESVEWHLPTLAQRKSLKYARPSIATIDRFNVQYVFGQKGN